MKKIVAIMLAVICLMGVLCSCSGDDANSCCIIEICSDDAKPLNEAFTSFSYALSLMGVTNRNIKITAATTAMYLLNSLRFMVIVFSLLL